MASIQISIPDEFVPGVVARMYDANQSREVPYADMEQFLSEYAEALASGACFDYKVGPYFEGPINPRFNADGTPWDGSQAEVGEVEGEDLGEE